MHLNQAEEDAQRDTIEEQRYFNRLNRANARQNMIFQKHFEEVFKQQDEDAQRKEMFENVTLDLMKKKLDERAKFEEENQKLVKVDYGEQLRKQIEEKNRIMDTVKMEKEMQMKDLAMKRVMLEEKEKKTQMENKMRQQQYIDMLRNQQMFKGSHAKMLTGKIGEIRGQPKRKLPPIHLNSKRETGSAQGGYKIYNPLVGDVLTGTAQNPYMKNYS